MNMSKNQIAMAAVGGVALVGAAVLGYLAYDVSSEKGEAEDELQSAKDRVQKILRADISADAASVAEINKNRDMLVGWCEAALSTAAAGDRAVRAGINPAAFKQQLVDEARVLSELEGGVDGKVVKPGFTFGLPDFVTGDKLPEKELLPRFQRLWGDVRFVFEQLQACGVTEIVRIEPVGAAPAPGAQAQQDEKPKPKKGKVKKDAEEEKPSYTVEQYAVDFRAKPAALVKAINALATSTRFIVVDSMSFAREGDMIATALGEGEKRSSDQPTSGRRRRRRGGEEQPAEAAEPASEGADVHKGIANDPDLEAPFLVKAIVSTYDFGTAAAPADEAPAGEPPQDDAATDSKEEEE